MPVYNNFDTVAGPPEGIAKMNAAFDETKGTGHDHSGDGNGAPIDAADIINEPSGNITATNVQGVIDQINSRLKLSHNYLDNSDFYNWERATTFTINNATQYTADRWLAGSGTGGTALVGRAVVAIGDHDVWDINPDYVLNFNQTVAATTVPFLIQRCEDVRTLESKTVTLSFVAYLVSGSPQTVNLQLQQSFGTGGSPSSLVGTSLGSVTLTTTRTKFTKTIALPPIFGKTLGTNGDHYLALSIQFPTGTTFNACIGTVQLEEGSVATPFTIGDRTLELERCQRFGLALNYETIGITSNGTYTYNLGLFSYPVQMRKVPILEPGAIFNGPTPAGTVALSAATLKSCCFINSANNWPTGVGVSVKGFLSADL